MRWSRPLTAKMLPFTHKFLCIQWDRSMCFRRVRLFSSGRSASTSAGAWSPSDLFPAGSQSPHQTGSPETRAQLGWPLLYTLWYYIRIHTHTHTDYHMFSTSLWVMSCLQLWKDCETLLGPLGTDVWNPSLHKGGVENIRDTK